MARAIDDAWSSAGEPDPWIVVDAGAGRGALAESVLRAQPRCAPALRYLCVERSAALREAAADHLPVEAPALVLGPGTPVAGEDSDIAVTTVPGRGPLVTVLGELPATPFTGVVIANELLDNLPFDLLEWRADEWWEVRVGESDGRPTEVRVPFAGDIAELVPDRADGARVPVQNKAAAWLASVFRVLERGGVVVIDYCVDHTAALAARPQAEWLRTYRAHGRGGHPLDRPGAQDITCEVAIDQLAHVRPPTATCTQAEWLDRHGLGSLLVEARAAWAAAAAQPDLASLQARSRLTEAEALRDPNGLGAFRVLEWSVGVED
jgi:SAM-dependent MidA family methyltransferase